MAPVRIVLADDHEMLRAGLKELLEKEPDFKVVDKNNVDLKRAKIIGIKATDNLSGIKKYRATIDGKWVLCEYEVKQDLLFYIFDNDIKPGNHTFNIDVIDDKNNVASWGCSFVR